jgi:hypothetical protein
MRYRMSVTLNEVKSLMNFSITKSLDSSPSLKMMAKAIHYIAFLESFGF